MIEKKYLITLFDAPVIFDNHIAHAELKIQARSAGYVRIWVDPDTKRVKAICYGESISLGLKASRNSDEKIIENFLNINEESVI